MAGRSGEPHIPLTLQRSRLKAEEKTLDFEFEVVSAQFNRRGCYALRLTVGNPLLQGSGAGIQLRINSGNVAWSSSGTTDTIEQRHLNQIYSFQRRKFTFTLPRGFCKNDKNHDVRLHIEALHFPRRPGRMRRGRRVGEAFFAIYPRPDQPRLKLSAGRDEDWYRYSAVLALLRVGSEQPAMHCGRLAFTASLHEHRDAPAPAAPLPGSPGGQEDQQAAGVAPEFPNPGILYRSLRSPESAYHSLPTEHLVHSPEGLQTELSSSPELLGGSDECPSSSSSSSVPAVLSCSSFHLSSLSSSPDPASSLAQVSKSPAGMESPRPTPVAGREHVARVGKETITVTLHGARNLPATRDGQVPWPYVVVKTRGGAEQKPEASRASSVPTHAPTWDEEVTVEMDAEDAGGAVLTLTVADKVTKEALGTFQLPVRHFQPFQPHHCRLVLPRTQDPVGTILHITITRRRSFIPRCNGLGYVALEVLLQGVSPPLTTLPGPLVAVARIVTNVQEYKHHMETHPTSHPGISPTTITFPDPPAAAFSMARAANHGCPQISRPAGPQEQPAWNASFLLQGQDVATIFSEDTALTIEFYPYKAVWDDPGTLIPVGYSVLPLTSRVFQELSARRGRMWVDGLAMEGTNLQTTAGTTPTVRLSLRLLQSERPAAFLTPSGSDALPSLDPDTLSTLERGEEPQATPLYPLFGQLHQDDVSFPAMDAVASILPGKQPFPHGEQRSQEISGDHQELDVSSCRLALKRMAGDLLSLRRHVTSLEVENGHLRRSLASQEELGHTLLHDTDLDIMTREELLDRLTTLRNKLVSGTAERRRLKDRVQQLQNELIRKNDREKELVLLQRAHRLQQATLRRCQEKVAKARGLEETVRQQQKLIQVMERVLQEKLSGTGRSREQPAAGALSGYMHTALLAENRWLREELAKDPHPAPPSSPGPPALPGVLGGTEKLSLLARLEEAQARSRVLERQLEKAARRWGREKQELGTRLLEQEHGFPASSNLTEISMAPRSRPRTLPPLP